MTSRWIRQPRPYSTSATSLGILKMPRHRPLASERFGSARGESLTAWAQAASGTTPRGRRGEGGGIAGAELGAGAAVAPFAVWRPRAGLRTARRSARGSAAAMGGVASGAGSECRRWWRGRGWARSAGVVAGSSGHDGVAERPAFRDLGDLGSPLLRGRGRQLGHRRARRCCRTGTGLAGAGSGGAGGWAACAAVIRSARRRAS